MSASDPKEGFGSIKGVMALMAFTLIMALASIISAERFVWQIDDSKSLIQEHRDLFALQNLSSKMDELTLIESMYATSQNKQIADQKAETTKLLTYVSETISPPPGRSDMFSETRQLIFDAVQKRLLLDKEFSNRVDSKQVTNIDSELAKVNEASKGIDMQIANLQSSMTRMRDVHDSEMSLARAIVDQILSLLWIFVLIAGSMLARQAFVYVMEKRKMENLVKGAESRFREAERTSEEKTARLAAIFETAPVGITTLGSNGKIDSSNDAMLNIFGYAPNELELKEFVLLVPAYSEILGVMQESFAGAESKVVHHITDTIGIRKTGAKFHIQLALSLLSGPSGPLVIGVIDDITPREQAQQKIRDFYSTVSHELRTPLTSIRTALSLMDSFDSEQRNPKMSPVLDIAQVELDRLIRLINDMLDIRKIEEGKMVLRRSEVSVKTLVQKATDSISALATASKVRIETVLKYKSKISCDEDRILQILTNLLSNAVKFSTPDSEVRLEVEQVDEDCMFSVIDTGPGISNDDLDKLFRKYEQLSLYDGKERAGTGLGLAIAKAITEEHKGTIGVDNTLKLGSRFWFRIPIKEIVKEVVEQSEATVDQLAGVSGEKTLKA
jgi:PAS domain S-box-containing protein